MPNRKILLGLGVALSIDTVKWHLKSVLYGKLGVSGLG